MTSIWDDPLLWIATVVLCAAVLIILRARRTNMILRGNNARLQGERNALQQERDHIRAAHAELREQHSVEVAEVRKDAEEDTKTVLKSAMRTLQVLADEQQVVIDRVQKKYGDDPQILADLMAIDHANSQFGRRAQGIAVLCGGWLGRREAIASVYDVARSAQGRIRRFDRVQIHAQVHFTVASRAVEPVAVVLAELLANATNYSAPDTPVEINIRAVPKGVCVIVDDAGLGMSQEEKDRAALLLSPSAPVGITTLGNPPKFGFAVAGMLAARYGFEVSVDSVSPYGGVRAVILLPEDLLSNEVPAPQPEAVHTHDAAEPAPPKRLAPVSAPVPMPATGTTAGGLPKRRRQRVTVLPQPAAPAASGSGGTPAPEPEPASGTRASRIGAFQRGTLSGRDMTNTEGLQDQ
ncbi:ATP-binding protein [Streptomyces sp. MI02-7b]|uniref:ATP-binding protein n=1 Tax=Streptomyces sp. MI02-7b TaxID=462941 RepID=UPI0029B63FB0|nr:ATP-binding protein [Streptomyces sp. MI02-7b]MDX3072736.1 ATP-binding protein [Streptomyces sp. MI02-7b]